MRVLPENLIPATFTSSQRAFVEGWYSLTNAESLDSHRVRTLNARLVLRELTRVCTLVESGIISSFHREAVASEAFAVLEHDPIYSVQFAGDWRILRPVLADPEYVKGDKAGRAVELRVLAEDALHRAAAGYSNALIADLTAKIAAGADADTIARLTSALLTDLTDRQFSTSNLYGFYAFFTSRYPNGSTNTRTFDDRFNYLVEWLRREKEGHEVVLKLSNAQKLTRLGQFGEWKFDTSVAQVSSDPHEANFVRPGTGVIFAIREVTSRDHREAAAESLRSWSTVLDQLLFDYVPDPLPTDSRYRCRRLRDDRIDVGRVAERVPNPRERSSADHLVQFSNDLQGAMLGTCALLDEDKRQIEAAIRYLRLGTESSNYESMFLTRWIAMESLLRSVRPDNQISGVCDGVAHLMSVTFIERMHADLVTTARYLRRPLPPSLHALARSGNSTTLDRDAVAQILRDPQLLPDLVDAFDLWPLYQHRLRTHAKAISQPKELLTAVQKHERNVRWQVQRSYRVRNEIVHSASHSVPLLSLVSHLEYYLRTSLRTVLRLLARRPHTASLRDLFHRIAAARSRLEQDLKAKQMPVALFDPLELQ